MYRPDKTRFNVTLTVGAAVNLIKFGTFTGTPGGSVAALSGCTVAVVFERDAQKPVDEGSIVKIPPPMGPVFVNVTTPLVSTSDPVPLRFPADRSSVGDRQER